MMLGIVHICQQLGWGGGEYTKSDKNWLENKEGGGEQVIKLCQHVSEFDF